ncbi:MAG TPA: hypothetical protein VFN29_13005 [Chiayiivirga sp.]|nr:hypothetical protein [Chiayiivirga sp.]
MTGDGTTGIQQIHPFAAALVVAGILAAVQTLIAEFMERSIDDIGMVEGYKEVDVLRGANDLVREASARPPISANGASRRSSRETNSESWRPRRECAVI